jgi:superfamily I DNA/RNA helicase
VSWLVPYSDLTPEQLQSVEATPDQHRLVVGGPGSGKTLVLLHRAAWLRKRFNVNDKRFRIFVYTNVLKDYIRAGCQDLGLPLDAVGTYDHWCKEYFEQFIGGRLPWDSKNKQPNFTEIRARVAQDVRKTQRELYDFVLVDEGQDLDGETFEVLRTVARHVTVAADRKQQIYEHGASEDLIAGRLGLTRRNLSLLGAFRCSPHIVTLAGAFLNDARDAAVLRAQTKTHTGHRETPVLFVARDWEEERERLAAAVRERLIKGERIAILLPKTKQLYGFRKAMTEFGLETEVQGRGEVLDFASTTPKLLTYHSAKGLTFDSVALPRLVDGSFRGRDEQLVLRMIFVAVTRAVGWVYMSTVRDAEPPFLARVRALAASGDLTLRESSERAETVSSTPSPSLSRPSTLEDLF